MPSDQHSPRRPGRILTIVIRDDSPMIFCDDSPTYRSVRIPLTDEQMETLALRWVGRSGVTDYHETISKVFLEPEETP